MNIENLESLNDFLTNLQDENNELKSTIDLLEEKADYSKWEWLRHEFIERDDYRKDLPCPRIEINVFKSRYKHGWITGIVHPEYGDNKKDTFVPLDRTTTSRTINLEKTELPWRGEFHMYAYSRMFNLRMFMTQDEELFIKELFVNKDHLPNLRGFENDSIRI